MKCKLSMLTLVIGCFTTRTVPGTYIACCYNLNYKKHDNNILLKILFFKCQNVYWHIVPLFGKCVSGLCAVNEYYQQIKQIVNRHLIDGYEVVHRVSLTAHFQFLIA